MLMRGSGAPSSPWLGIVALGYVALDFWRERNPHSIVGQWLQPCLWGGLAIAAIVKATDYRHWGSEIRAFPKLLLAIAFMLAALAVEGTAVHFVTAVMGLQWHRTTAPLPDTGQWIFLALNRKLPSALVAFLRAPLIGLHHYIMLFAMLGFSSLFGFGRPPHIGLTTRYIFAMGLGRLLRVATFAGTILPSARPWCADSRFEGTADHPHPWAQTFYTPYAHDEDALRNLLRNDWCPAVDASAYEKEYTPNWGIMQFLVTLLRPPNPAQHGRHSWQGDTWISTLARAGGGCNDLAFSGHILVSSLTAMAWQEVYPGWASTIVWLLVLHSGQREIRERHHYSLDVVMGVYAGVLLWKITRFVWTMQPPQDDRGLGEGLDGVEGALRKAAKDGDIETIRSLLDQASRRRWPPSVPETSKRVQRLGVALVIVCIALPLIAFRVLQAG